MRDRGENARAPDLEHDVLDDGCHLLGRKFERDSEARRFACITERLLVRTFVHFHDNAVDPVFESTPSRALRTAPSVPIFNDVIDSFPMLEMRVYFETQAAQILELLLLSIMQLLAR